jgi:antitoxin (DNA-binding transcriptional repressor) of toxin-antitoxin stability system
MQLRILNIKQLPPATTDLLAMITGGDLVIEDDGKAVAYLSPIPPQTNQRIAGLHEGEGWMSEDFDDPLPDEFWNGRV